MQYQSTQASSYLKTALFIITAFTLAFSLLVVRPVSALSFSFTINLPTPATVISSAQNAVQNIQIANSQAQQAITNAGSQLSTSLTNVGNAATAAGNNAVTNANNTVNSAVTGANSAVTGTEKTLGVDTTITAAQQQAQTLLVKAQTLLAQAATQTGSAAQTLLNQAQAALTQAQQVAGTVASQVQNGVSQTQQEIQQSLNSASQQLQAGITQVGVQVKQQINQVKAGATAAAAATQTQFNQVQQQVTGAINGGIADLKTAASSLDFSLSTTNGLKLTASALGFKADALISPSGEAYASFAIPSISPDVKAALQKSANDTAATLTSLEKQVEAATDPTALQQKAAQIQQAVTQAVAINAQAVVTKAIDSQTAVLGSMVSTYNVLQSEVSQLKTCIQSGSLSASGTNGDVKVSASAPKCSDLAVANNSGDGGKWAQEQLASIKTSMDAERSFLQSSTNVISQLATGSYNDTVTALKGVGSILNVSASLSSDTKNNMINLYAAISS